LRRGSQNRYVSGVERPADFAANQRCITAWPHDPVEWPGELLLGARAEVAAMIRAIVADGGEEVVLLTHDEDCEASARAALSDVPVRYLRMSYGDIWLRDTGPLFVHTDAGLRAQCFRTNGWGGKFDFADDHGLGARVADALDVTASECDWILEGGALEANGTGVALTTEQCLLNPNRNPSMSRTDIEQALHRDLGISKVIWIEHGLAGDHTDGHIDNLARFVDPRTIACMQAASPDDPNSEVLAAIEATLRSAVDGDGRPFRVERIPSPGRVIGTDGAVLPASYMNFYVARKTVVVPTYGTNDRAALDALRPLFPDRRVIGVRSDHLLRGGGSFHCITQQQPEDQP